MESTRFRLAKPAGFLVGLGVALVATVMALSAWTLPRGSGSNGADVTVATGPTGELGIPIGPFVRGNDLRPGGDPAEGTIPVRNQTGTDLAVTVRAMPSIPDLDDLMMVQVSAGSRSVYRGTLAGLEVGSGQAFLLRPGRTRDLAVRAWLPGSVSDGYQNRIEDVTLAFDVQAQGA
jgi:hypothetical protein